MAAIKKHATMPHLEWVRRNTYTSCCVVMVKPGDAEERVPPNPAAGFHYSTTKPSYEELWANHQTAMDRQLAEVEHSIVFYQGKIKEWAPAPAKEVDPKRVMVHLAVPWKNRLNESSVPACRQMSLSRPKETRLTLDPAEVTCERCIR